MQELDHIADAIRAELETENAVRDEALTQSRLLIRTCANAIRAVHREEWAAARAGLETTRAAAQDLIARTQPHPDLFHSGYTQDALKEYVEAFVTYAIVRGEELPSPQALGVPGATYLNGLAEAASELRRTILTIIRHEHSERAEGLLSAMDTVYAVLMTFDFPDAVTYGLRRRVDSLRGVLERTRGDVTNSFRQQRLEAAITSLEKKLDLPE